MCASLPESRAKVLWGGGWAQESHVVENVAALRPWQEILRGKYRTKSIIRGSWAIDDAIHPGGVGGGKAG